MTILVGEPKRLKSAPQVWTNTEGSMAAETVRKRWPQTVTNMAEDIKQSAAELDIAAKKEEGFEIARAVEELKAEIQQNEQLK
jgi:anti-sigma28 factor (negative regulator of flagellin synthesis)